MPDGKRLRSIRAILSFLGALVLVFVSAPRAGALEFLETTWGFDGKAVIDTFNPLTAVVRNDSAFRFDGAVRLEESQGMGKSGGTYLEPCYLEPGATRVLQFYPKVSNPHNRWRLSDGRDSHELGEPKEGLPADVRLVDGDDPLIRSSGIFRHFPHQRFPTTIGAADGLWLVALDYVPNFSPAQRSAFLDWLKGGGQVHLFKNAAGKHPVFEQEDLSPAPNDSGANWRRAGHGRVFWHDAPLEGLTETKWKSLHGEPGPVANENPSYYGSFDPRVFQNLDNLTRLRIAWPLVYLSAFLYIVLLGPGHFLWARKKTRDYRIVLLVLLVSFALFSAIFAVIGRRGYGERTTVSSVALARHIEGNRFDVATWASVFVTSGNDYEFKHPSPHNLYATGDTYESINATMLNGRDGSMRVEIPIYSSKHFVHRGTMPGPEPPALTGRAPLTWKWTGPDTPLNAWLDDNGRVFDVRIDVPNQVMSVQGVESREFEHMDSSYYDSGAENSEAGHRRVFLDLAKSLIARATGISEETRRSYINDHNPAAIDLYVVAQAPESFRLPAGVYDRQDGYVVYRFQYPKSE